MDHRRSVIAAARLATSIGPPRWPSWWPICWSTLVVTRVPKAVHECLGEIHETLGEIFYWMIAADITASLWHHFLRRNNTLRRMR